MRTIFCTICLIEIEGKTFYFTQKRHIDFIRRVFKECHRQYVVCSSCFNITVECYEMNRATGTRNLKENRLKSKAILVSNPSLTSTSLSTVKGRNGVDIHYIRNLLKEGPLTFAATSTTRKRTTDALDYVDNTAIGNGSELADIEPIPKKRRRVENADKNVMNMNILPSNLDKDRK